MQTPERDSTNNYKRKVTDYLKDLEKDTGPDHPSDHRLHPEEATPCICGLPNIHKEGVPLRPIISSTWMTENLHPRAQIGACCGAQTPKFQCGSYVQIIKFSITKKRLFKSSQTLNAVSEKDPRTPKL